MDIPILGDIIRAVNGIIKRVINIICPGKQVVSNDSKQNDDTKKNPERKQNKPKGSVHNLTNDLLMKIDKGATNFGDKQARWHNPLEKETCNILLVGRKGCGKSALFDRYVSNVATIDKTTLSRSESVLWDFDNKKAGLFEFQEFKDVERFMLEMKNEGNVRKTRLIDPVNEGSIMDLLKDIDSLNGAILVYSLIDRDSFDDLQTFWIEAVVARHPFAKLFICGTHLDVVELTHRQTCLKDGVRTEDLWAPLIMIDPSEVLSFARASPWLLREAFCVDATPGSDETQANRAARIAATGRQGKLAWPSKTPKVTVTEVDVIGKMFATIVEHVFDIRSEKDTITLGKTTQDQTYG